MIANKIVLAVALASVAFVQINAKASAGRAKSEETLETEFKNALKNLTLNFAEFNEKTSEYTKLVRSSVSSLFDFKYNPSTLRSTLEGKIGVSDFVKDSLKQLQENVEDYSKKFPKELTDAKKYNEIYESGLKAIAQTAAELLKNAQGNTEAVQTLKEFTSSLIENLVNQVKSIRAKFSEKKA